MKLIAVLCLYTCLTGCVSDQYYVEPVIEDGVIVEEEMIAPLPPPDLLPEVVTVAPSSSHIWVHGYWHWGGDHYYWIPGNWIIGISNKKWIQSHYYYHPRGRVWMHVKGHWHRDR